MHILRSFKSATLTVTPDGWMMTSRIFSQSGPEKQSLPLWHRFTLQGFASAATSAFSERIYNPVWRLFEMEMTVGPRYMPQQHLQRIWKLTITPRGAWCLCTWSVCAGAQQTKTNPPQKIIHIVIRENVLQNQTDRVAKHFKGGFIYRLRDTEANSKTNKQTNNYIMRHAVWEGTWRPGRASCSKDVTMMRADRHGHLVLF